MWSVGLFQDEAEIDRQPKLSVAGPREIYSVRLAKRYLNCSGLLGDTRHTEVRQDQFPWNCVSDKSLQLVFLQERG